MGPSNFSELDHFLSHSVWVSIRLADVHLATIEFVHLLVVVLCLCSVELDQKRMFHQSVLKQVSVEMEKMWHQDLEVFVVLLQISRQLDDCLSEVNVSYYQIIA